MKIFKIFIMLSAVFPLPVMAFDRNTVMADFKVLEKELKLLAREQYAHESAESDKVRLIPGYKPNYLLPSLKSKISSVIERIITFRSTALSNPKDSKNCKVSLDKYLNVSLPEFKAAYVEYVDNKSTLFVGVQGIVMANSVDGAAFISGPAFECGQ